MELNELTNKYLDIVNSEKNRENKKYWDNADERYLVERWRGRSSRRTDTPYTMAMDISGYARVLGIDCLKYYSDPETQLKEQLRYAIWEYENIDCQRYFEDAVFISFGSVFEAAMFGAKINYLPAQAPWYDEQDSVLKDKANLLKLPPFDFYRSGLCPIVHEYYGQYKKLLGDTPLDVMFPLTLRSPFSTAIMLRGFENLLMDIYDDPEFFKDLMDTITGYLKEYATERAKFTGEPMTPGMLFNDEISTPMLSNGMYEEFILPGELELARHWGGVRYWHSCGVTQDFYETVSNLPGLKMMHIGPWSDIPRAAAVFGAKDIAIEICVNANRDMYEKTFDEMVSQLNEIKDACDGKVRYSVRCDGIAVLFSEEECLSKMKEWERAAKQVFPG